MESDFSVLKKKFQLRLFHYKAQNYRRYVNVNSTELSMTNTRHMAEYLQVDIKLENILPDDTNI